MPNHVQTISIETPQTAAYIIVMHLPSGQAVKIPFGKREEAERVIAEAISLARESIDDGKFLAIGHESENQIKHAHFIMPKKHIEDFFIYIKDA